MKLLKHQEKYAKGYKDKAFLVHETGTGKSVCASVWLKDGRDSDALVIAPKRVLKKWEKNLKDWKTKATVISKEQLKKTTPRIWSAIVVDESDEFASPLFVKGRSGLAESLYNLISIQPETPIMLLTATPVRSNPWNIHTQLCYLGTYIDWKKWRDRFFELQFLPYLPRPAYIPNDDWREHMKPLLEKYADIVLLKDCVGELPSEKVEIVKIPYVSYKSNELTPTARFVDEHKHEQINKPKEIIKLARGYRKVIVVAYYVEQVESLAKELQKDRLTFMVHGGVKEQEKILKEANSVDECFLVVQASLGVGWDGDTFSSVMFTSMSYKVRDWVQLKGRVRRIHNLNPVHYVYLMGGRCDENVYEIIQKGRDFIPSEWCDTAKNTSYERTNKKEIF